MKHTDPQTNSQLLQVAEIYLQLSIAYKSLVAAEVAENEADADMHNDTINRLDGELFTLEAEIDY